MDNDPMLEKKDVMAAATPSFSFLEFVSPMEDASSRAAARHGAGGGGTRTTFVLYSTLAVGVLFLGMGLLFVDEEFIIEHVSEERDSVLAPPGGGRRGRARRRVLLRGTRG